MQAKCEGVTNSTRTLLEDWVGFRGDFMLVTSDELGSSAVGANNLRAYMTVKARAENRSPAFL